MDLRLEDLQTEETHLVDQGGASLGRDSRRSTIVIADPGVSGAHAKITHRNGRYFVEDSNSSNGTFVDGARLRGELELHDGFVLALHKYKFRVSIEGNGGGAGDSTALFEPRVVSPKKSKPQRQDNVRTMGHAPTRTEAQGDMGDGDGPDEDSLSSPLPVPRRQAAARSRDSEQVDEPDDQPYDEDESMGFDAGAAAEDLQGGFGRALAYYLAAVPKMALMPQSTVAEMIENQPIPEMEKGALIAWALPPALLTVFMTLLSTVVVGVVSHAFGMAMLMSALISSAITIVVFAALAFFFHPIATWWVKLLKGESTARSRTNWFVTTYTATALTLIVNGISVMFGLLSGVRYIGPFIQIVPLVLATLATLITLYAAYAWHVHFRVIHWFPKIFMVAGVVMIALGALGIINQVRASVAGGGAGVTADNAAAAAASAEVLKAQAELQARADAAIAQQKALQNGGTPPPTAQTPSTPSATPTAQPTSPAAQPAAAAKPPEAAPTAAAKTGELTFADYTQQSEAIEKVVSDDPSILSRTPGALALYKKLHSTASKFKAGKGKADSPNERIRQAELYAATVDIVQELYGKLVH